MDRRNEMSTYLITMIWVASNIVDFCMMFPFITIWKSNIKEKPLDSTTSLHNNIPFVFLKNIFVSFGL
jgi:hypothetical protein